jgi:hypothetical protein
MFEHWMERLEWMSKHNGDYYPEMTSWLIYFSPMSIRNRVTKPEWNTLYKTFDPRKAINICLSTLIMRRGRFGNFSSNDNQIELGAVSVDRFQGSEKDFVILTCVRSNRWGNIGFMDEPKRINVALTRARMGLIIVGDAATLMRTNPRWRSFLRFVDQKGVFVEGHDWYQTHRSPVLAEEERQRSEQQPKVQPPVRTKIKFTKRPKRT